MSGDHTPNSSYLSQDDYLGEIALCILSAVNVGKIKSDEELEELCDLSVRSLDELIDYQDYPDQGCRVANQVRRSLGIGFIGLAHYLAKLGCKYDSQEAMGCSPWIV